MYTDKEILEALETPLEVATIRQHIIKGIHGLLNAPENSGKSRPYVLEEHTIKIMQQRRRKLITQKEYRVRMQVIELFYFN